ncbi:MULTISPECIES: hypothetical protein [Streptomyces]|uniref:hypothetical protein n=1 Tax=Streptomyces TaxID=1883 RepID=UPI0006EBC27C|nr:MULTISPECIES: hypothetical protein [Streptomyces]MCP3770251.1 hypothetical protein [Streptomyces sp. MAR25Y5]OBQ52035.1 hypothetical protein A4U61_07975 [Streptomyces sp. H-KF8]
MAKERKSPKPPGGGPSRHQGTEHHGWSPDVDETRQQENPSARRSFHAEEHAPSRGPGRKRAKEERGPVPGDVVGSDARRGEEYGAEEEKGMRDTGRRGRSGRPSGTKDEDAFTGVDPDDSDTGHRPG